MFRQVDESIHLPKRDRPPVGPLGEGVEELFQVHLFDRTRSVQGGVALGRPRLGHGFDTVAVYPQSRSQIAFLEQYGSDLLLEFFLLAVDLLVFRRIPLFEQDVPRIVPEPGTVLPTDPSTPRVVNPGLEGEGPLLPIARQGPAFDTVVPRPALVLIALQVETDLEWFFGILAALMNKTSLADRPVAPCIGLRVVGGDLYGDPVVGRPAYPADILVRTDPVVAVPALKDLVVGLVLVPLIFT